MKKIFKILLICLLLSLVLLIISCGTRKTDTQQRDSIHIENNYSQGTKIVLGNTFTYKPFDASKPMILDGKKYENAIVSNDKSISKTDWKTVFIKEVITIHKTRKTKKTDHTILYIGLFIALVLGVLAWFKLPSFKS